MRRNLVVGNWKMNGSGASIEKLLDGLSEGLAGIDSADAVVCPPAVFITQVAQALKVGDKLAWGAQTLSEHDQGAYTGEVSACMLAELGCKYAIVGHSERRTLFAENDQDIAAKFVAAQAQGMIPILCVGESLAQREAGETLSWIERQIMAVIDIAGIRSMGSAVIAYEPIWAIGTGQTATPEQAQEVHAFIRSMMASLDSAIADGVQVLYGGSVNADNAAELFLKSDIDGALVGGASLKVSDFVSICRAAN